MDGLDRIEEQGYVKNTTPIASLRSALASGENAASVIGTARIPQKVCTYYDSTTLPSGFVPEEGVVEGEDIQNIRCLTMLKTEKVYEDIGYNSTTSAAALCWRERTFFYDSKGRTVQVKETGSDGWTSRYSSSYDFTGNLTSYVERHFYGSHEDCVKYVYQYDLRGRKTLARRWLNGREFTPVHYVYDDLGRKALIDCEDKVTELYSYNLQGWPKTQDVLLYGQPEAFQMSLRHYDPDDPQAEPVFGGFVSEAVSKHMGQDERTVIYRYDDLGRVIDATEVGGLSETMVYDDNGNILAASRMNGGSSATRTYFTHSGNCLQKVTENNRPWSFTYWPNGNLKTDAKENLSFSYNFSNLLTDVRKGATQIATITYLADGTKVKVKATGGAGLLYRGRFIYRYVLDGLPTIESVEHDHGRFLPGNSANEFIDTWHVRDYLGSTRAVFDITPDYVEDLTEVILEQNDYCLFGSRIDNADLPTLAQNRFRFNGKEKLIAGANDTKLTDYGARMYSAPLARWTTPDPLADKYYSTSPYAFCNNNPVNYVDPDGKAIETAWDIASIGLGIGSLVKNIKDGNIKGAIGDGLGIAADVVAAAVPFLPGGVGALRAAAKTVNAVDNLTDAAKAANVLDKTEDAVQTTKHLDNVGNATKNNALTITPENQIDRNLLELPKKRGNAFIFKEDGSPVEIHHADQNPNGPFIEMHKTTHRGPGNYNKNHPNENQSSKINRKEFKVQKQNYWKQEYDKYNK